MIGICQTIVFVIVFGPVTECGQWESAEFGRGSLGNFAVFPARISLREIMWKRLRRTAELYPPSFGGLNAFFLPLANIGSFILCYKRQNLKYDVAEKRTNEIFSSASVKKRHIDDHDIYPLFLCENAPLFLDFLIIAAETVDALDHEEISGTEFSDEFFVLRPVKIFAGQFVHVYIFRWYAVITHADLLPVFVLITRTDANITISFHMNAPSMFSLVRVILAG